jgi:N-glycosylase/DNA lyase
MDHFLESFASPISARTWMVSHVAGLGPKQASMFLRNVISAFDLAVIDRHVTRYIRALHLCDLNGSYLATMEGYEYYEASLRRYAESVGYSVGVLDWAIWIVMRAAARM